MKLRLLGAVKKWNLNTLEPTEKYIYIEAMRETLA